MRPHRLIAAAALVTVATVALIAAACSGGNDAPAVTYEGLDGASLYSQACARCHGVDLTGTNQGPPFLDATYTPGHHADASFLLAARGGAPSHHWNFGPMPPVPGLSDEQIEAIVDFVRTQQRAAGFD